MVRDVRKVKIAKRNKILNVCVLNKSFKIHKAKLRELTKIDTSIIITGESNTLLSVLLS